MKKAIIIGASSGIGKELALILSRNNYTVGITGRREELLDNIRKSNEKRFIVRSFDITQNNRIEKLKELIAELNGLDLLVF